LVAGKDEAYKAMKVTCLIATIPDDPTNPIAEQVMCSKPLMLAFALIGLDCQNC
jgi:hypothetical protein